MSKTWLLTFVFSFPFFQQTSTPSVFLIKGDGNSSLHDAQAESLGVVFDSSLFTHTPHPIWLANSDAAPSNYIRIWPLLTPPLLLPGSNYRPLSAGWLLWPPSALAPFKSILFQVARLPLLKWKFRTLQQLLIWLRAEIKALTMATKPHEGPASFLIFTLSLHTLNFMQCFVHMWICVFFWENLCSGHQILKGIKISQKLKNHCLEETSYLKIQFKEGIYSNYKMIWKGFFIFKKKNHWVVPFILFLKNN